MLSRKYPAKNSIGAHIVEVVLVISNEDGKTPISAPLVFHCGRDVARLFQAGILARDYSEVRECKATIVDEG